MYIYVYTYIYICIYREKSVRVQRRPNVRVPGGRGDADRLRIHPPPLTSLMTHTWWNCMRHASNRAARAHSVTFALIWNFSLTPKRNYTHAHVHACVRARGTRALLQMILLKHWQHAHIANWQHAHIANWLLTAPPPPPSTKSSKYTTFWLPWKQSLVGAEGSFCAAAGRPGR